MLEISFLTAEELWAIFIRIVSVLLCMVCLLVYYAKKYPPEDPYDHGLDDLDDPKDFH